MRVKDRFDLVVVGAGPGGLAAAATAGESGMDVLLLDDNPQVGGQIWRPAIFEENGLSAPAARWFSRLGERVEVRCGWRAVESLNSSPNDSRILRIEREGNAQDIRFSALILATGARELFLPFPGWTLPGVYGAAGLQALVKSGLDVAGKRILVAGTGPLLLAVATAMRKAGARIVSIVEQASFARLVRFSLGLVNGHAGKILEAARYGWALRGVPFHAGAWVSRVTREGELRVMIKSTSTGFDYAADMLAIGFHLVPNTEVARMLNCEMEDGFVCVNAMQETSVRNIYCVGELTGIGGVEKAQIEGRIAALAVAGQVEKTRTLLMARDGQARFARSLQAAFALRNELRGLSQDETFVCRCEDVPHGLLRPCRSWREAKLHTRCGMGPCQGRVCGPAAHFLYGWEIPAPRPPVFPTAIASLAGPPEN